MKTHPNILDFDSHADYLIAKSYWTFLKMLPLPDDQDIVDPQLIQDLEEHANETILLGLPEMNLIQQLRALEVAIKSYERKYLR